MGRTALPLPVPKAEPIVFVELNVIEVVITDLLSIDVLDWKSLALCTVCNLLIKLISAHIQNEPQ